MSQLSSSKWPAHNDQRSTTMPVTSGSHPRIPKARSQPSTSRMATSTPERSIASKSSSKKSSASSCGLCRRIDCQLRSHRAYLSGRQANSQISFQIAGSGNPGNAKPTSKSVDDQVIRSAFVQSYAYIEPSQLSTLQPSSFRLDVFHDLPVPGGDQPNTHQMMWGFLNNHVPLLIGSTLPHTTDVNELKGVYLEAAMTNSAACLSMLATEKAISEQIPNLYQQDQTPNLMDTYMDCSDLMLRQGTIDHMEVRNRPEHITVICGSLFPEQSGSQSPNTSPSTIDHPATPLSSPDASVTSSPRYEYPTTPTTVHNRSPHSSTNELNFFDFGNTTV